LAFKAWILRVNVHQQRKITLPARIQPINDNSYLIEIFRQNRHTIDVRVTSPHCGRLDGVQRSS
jgi:hypothetical protein